MNEVIQSKLTSARVVDMSTQSPQAVVPQGHVRLQLAVASLCGTDLHYFSHFSNAGFMLQNPVTLGHEACAYVTDPNGSDLKVGQLVALNPIINCQTCAPCLRGEENLCTAKKFPGSATTVPHLDGFFRDVIDHPARCCFPVSANVDPRHLTFAEPMACALHALNKGEVGRGKKVLVTGCGPMGLLAVAGAIARGAEVTALDLRAGAVEVAKAVGADGLVIGEFDEATLEKQFDVVVEASGAIPAFNSALKAVRPKGRVSILSNIQLREAQVNLNLIMLKEIEVVGSFQFNREFEEAVQLIEAGTVDFDVLTAAAYPLAGTGAALEAMAAGQAFGKIILLCAYNYPLALIGRKAGPALVAGNTMILKPHEATPVTASVFCRICQEAGLPPGVINMVTGTGKDVGAPLVESPTVRMITLTGSIRAGQMIAEASAKNITALSLELGGSAPFIVLKDADIEKAVEAAVIARFANAGQVCICNEAVLVEEAVADEFTEKLLARVAEVTVGDPKVNGGMGPITTPDALARVEKIVADSVAGGASIAAGGKRPEGAQFSSGNWYEPTVLVNATADTAAVREEIFGPVLPIVRVKDYEEALAIANARPDGLSAYLWTRDPSIYMDAIKRLETGTIFLNSGITGLVQGYHNGHKLSGLGGEDGVHGLEGYLQKRTVYMAY